MYILARNRNDAINKWLDENPVILGAGAIVLGLILGALGVSALVTGRAATKRGPELEGASAKAMGFVWLGFGVACTIFGIVKVISGLR